jgi:hypothetical protein
MQNAEILNHFDAGTREVESRDGAPTEERRKCWKERSVWSVWRRLPTSHTVKISKMTAMTTRPLNAAKVGESNERGCTQKPGQMLHMSDSENKAPVNEPV